MTETPPERPSAFSSVGAFLSAVSEHVGRALRVRLPVLKAVMELSEREVFAVGELVQKIQRESVQQVAELERIHREFAAELPSVAGPQRKTLAESIRELDAAHHFFLNLSRTMNSRIEEHGRLVRWAASSAKQIVEIAAEVGKTGSIAALVTLNARFEAGRLGQEAEPFVAIAEQLRELTHRVERAGQQINRLGQELVLIIPEIAQHATALQTSHGDATRMLDERMIGVRAVQLDALQTTAAAVDEGRSRADRMVRQLHELSARLQFQDSIAQDLTAILHQELASAKLVQRSLAEIPDNLPAPAAFETEARRAEHLSHALNADERKRQADDAGAGAEGQLESDDALFF